MIDVTCQSCGKIFHAKDEHAGRTGHCKCGAAIVVPHRYPVTIPVVPLADEPVMIPGVDVATDPPLILDAKESVAAPLRVQIVDIHVPFESLFWLILKMQLAWVCVIFFVATCIGLAMMIPLLIGVLFGAFK